MRSTCAFFLFGIVCLILSCQSYKQESKDVESQRLVNSTNSKYTTTQTAVTVSHQVKDYDAWLVAFNGHDSVRAAFGILEANIYRGVTDSMMVTVTAYTQGHEAARSFFSQSDLDEVMQNAGVISKPEVKFWDIRWTREGEKLPDFDGFYMVSCGVEEYDFWMTKYMEHDGERRANGVYSILTATEVDSVNNVGVLLGAVDLETANALFADPAMENVLKEAGVLGQPIVNVVRPDSYFKKRKRFHSINDLTNSKY